MYEIHESLTEYFAELDPKRRLEILDSLSDGEGVDSGFLHELYHDRYSDHENRGRKNVDWWLWRCICLQQLNNRGGFFRKFRKREVNAILEELRTNDTDPQHRAYLYHEYRNTAGRYLSTCKSGNYASRFMGFRQASDDEKALRACGDIWEMSRGIARSEGVEERMQVWCEAFRDEIFEYDPVCREEYARLDSER